VSIYTETSCAGCTRLLLLLESSIVSPLFYCCGKKIGGFFVVTAQILCGFNVVAPDHVHIFIIHTPQVTEGAWRKLRRWWSNFSCPSSRPTPASMRSCCKFTHNENTHTHTTQFTHTQQQQQQQQHQHNNNNNNNNTAGEETNKTHTGTHRGHTQTKPSMSPRLNR